jgi:hypothetical protein
MLRHYFCDPSPANGKQWSRLWNRRSEFANECIQAFLSVTQLSVEAWDNDIYLSLLQVSMNIPGLRVDITDGEFSVNRN